MTGVMMEPTNMPPTKKRARSPEADELSSARQSPSIQIHQNRLVKRRWRGPPDNRIKALEKLERGRRCEVVYQNPTHKPNPPHAPQINAPPPVTSPLRCSPGPTVPHSPPLQPEGGAEYDPEGFNFSTSPVSSHVLGLCSESSGKVGRLCNVE